MPGDLATHRPMLAAFTKAADIVRDGLVAYGNVSHTEGFTTTWEGRRVPFAVVIVAGPDTIPLLKTAMRDIAAKITEGGGTHYHTGDHSDAR